MENIKTRLLSYPVFSILILLGASVFDTSVSAQNLKRLEGTWCQESANSSICETWKTMPDGSLHGSGFAIKNGEKTHTEDLRIVRIGEKTAYIAHPAGQDLTLFNFTQGPKGSWIFTNQEHDFPKTIMYTWSGDDSLSVALFGKDTAPANQFLYKRSTNNSTKQDTMDKTPKATGIGGIFFKCEDPDKMKNWYSEHLGFATDQYGHLFEFRKAEDPRQKSYLQWSPMTDKTTYFEPSQKQFMINYRVQNIEKLVENLKAVGVTICDEIASYDYGKFVHIMDPEGNKIELWEPVDEVFTEYNK